MREGHMQELERWANYVKSNPGRWQDSHTRFINSQFMQHESFIRNILKEKDGRKKLIDLFGITNIKGYDFLR